ncbi:MAG: PcfJ domain-containing protein [Lachnospiraceae bacterium]|nr:PcfJ domain-containing protein [Lachnospiraceae bacterium]
MTTYELNKNLIKRLYPCEELSSEETPAFLEPYEEDILYQLENNYENKISCHAFVRKDDEGEAYFDVYFIDPGSDVCWNRFSIHKNKRLPEDEEKLFLDYTSNEYVVVDEKYFDRFLKVAAAYIDGYSLDNYIPGVFALRHLYYCYHRSGPKEMLFKAGLYYLADSFELVHDVNYLADNINELFDGMNIRLIRMLNAYNNVSYMYSKVQREGLKKLYAKYGDYMNNRYLEQSEIVYLFWCLDGITEFDKDVYKFVGYLDASEELINYMQYLELRKKFVNPKGYPKVFCNAEDMYCTIDQMEHMEDAVNNEYYYDREINNLMVERVRKYSASDDEYNIIIPASVHDIIEEGNIQRNCVIRYIPEYALGFTDLVFFVSKKNRNVHLTMRVVKGAVQEVKGKFNRNLTEEEKDFIERYCECMQIRHGSFD